jgi:hypothetical protein
METIPFIWNWLGQHSAQVTAVTAMIFGLSTAVVAWLALRLNHRNNYGTKPLLVVQSLGGAWDRNTGQA